MGRACGLEVHELTPAEARELYPLIEVGDLAGAIHIPADGQANPIDIAQALAKGARQNGARIVEGCRVTGIAKANGRVTGVETELGPIRADVVVNCAGMWGRAVGRMAGVSVPLHACEHFYVLTEPMPEVPPDLPVLRDPDGCLYVKEDAGKLLVGAFEPVAKPWGMDGIPDDFEFGELPEDWDHFMPILEDAMRRIPALERTGIRKFFCGPESFTPDDRYLLGEAPELAGFFVACGFNSIGIQSAGGAGKVLAEWIVGGHAPMDLADVDIRRMQPFQSNARYLRDRVSRGSRACCTRCTGRFASTPRRGRRAPRRCTSASRRGAPASPRPPAGSGRGGSRRPAPRPSTTTPTAAPPGSSAGRASTSAVRERVGLFDLSSFGKFLVQGRDAEAVLQRICANDVAVAPGRIVYTPWLNERGGIEADLTVTRLAADAYLVVDQRGQPEPGPALAAAPHPGSGARVRHRRDLGLCGAGLDGAGQPGAARRAHVRPTLPTMRSRSATAQEIELGYALVRAQRISYVGELGFELYIPSEFALPVFDVIAEAAGARLTFAGFHALDSLRLEKAYRHWGHDIGDEDTPLEAGLGFACAFDKPVPFIGRDALLATRERTPDQAAGAVQAAGSRAPAVPRRADRHGRRADRPAHLGLLWPHARRRDRHGLGAPPGRGHARTAALGAVRDRDRRRAPPGRSQPARLLRSQGRAPADVSCPGSRPKVRDRRRARRGC